MSNLRWASSGITTPPPTEGKKDAGFIAGEFPSYIDFNWLFNEITNNLNGQVAIFTEPERSELQNQIDIINKALKTFEPKITVNSLRKSATATTPAGASYVSIGTDPNKLKLTPGAGNYLMSFTGSVYGSNTNQIIWIGCFVNGILAQENGENIENFTMGFNGNSSYTQTLTGYLENISESDEIEIKWFSTVATGNIDQRNLILEKI